MSELRRMLLFQDWTMTKHRRLASYHESSAEDDAIPGLGHDHAQAPCIIP